MGEEEKNRGPMSEKRKGHETLGPAEVKELYKDHWFGVEDVERALKVRLSEQEKQEADASLALALEIPDIQRVLRVLAPKGWSVILRIQDLEGEKPVTVHNLLDSVPEGLQVPDRDDRTSAFHFEEMPVLSWALISSNIVEGTDRVALAEHRTALEALATELNVPSSRVDMRSAVQALYDTLVTGSLEENHTPERTSTKLSKDAVDVAVLRHGVTPEEDGVGEALFTDQSAGYQIEDLDTAGSATGVYASIDLNPELWR